MNITITKYNCICNLGRNIDEVYENAILGNNNKFSLRNDIIKDKTLCVGEVEDNNINISNPDYDIKCNRLLVECYEPLKEYIDSLIKKYGNKRIGVVVATTNTGVEEYQYSKNKTQSEIGNSTNTIRLALDFLASQGIIEAKAFRSNDSNWTLKKLPEFTENETALINTENEEITADTLVYKVEKELKDYIRENYKVGDRLPAHQELSEILKVSIKTVHDAMKTLIDEGYLLARRGRYGTTIIKIPDNNQTSPLLQPMNETSIFASAAEAAFYSYQKIENEIKKFIVSNYDIGDKLPSMEDLSKQFDVSSNTIRKALQNLSKQGIVNFSRGRYGGTFVVDLPENDTEETFRWLAVSSDYTISFDDEN